MTLWRRVKARIEVLTSEMFDIYLVSFGRRMSTLSSPSG